MKNIFDVIFNLKNFFIITQSEKENTDEFNRYRDNIINKFLQIKKII